MPIDLFICTKPMQWLNIQNIPVLVNDNSKKILMIVANFPNVERFAENVREYSNTWDEIVIKETRIKAAIAGLKIRPNRVFVDYDEGYVGTIYGLIPGKLYVYDEGIGTYYITNRLGKTGALKELMYKILGIGTFPGGSRKTMGIYVYNHNYYNHLHPGFNKQILQFNDPYNEFLEKNIEFLSKVFDVSEEFKQIRNKNILIYATSHTLKPEIIDFVKNQRKKFDEVWIKLHPQLALKLEEIADQIKDFIVRKELIMIEILIMLLVKENNLTIVHESSTACLYFNESEKLKFINFGGKFKDSFNEFKEYYN